MKGEKVNIYLSKISMKKNLIVILLLVVNTVINFGIEVDVNKLAQDYPYKKNPIVATVLGTPKEQWYKFKKGKAPKVKKFKNIKNVPEILREWKDYEYGVWTQEKEAPLMLIISGTGSLYNSGLSMYMANVFYDRGYNVIAFSSPTTMPYIVSQSKNNYAGYIKDEVNHLYDLMSEAIKIEKENKMKIKDVYVGGYSLGGFQSLLIHELDNKEKKININKSLILNSPVSIFTATQILDNYLIKNGIYDIKGLEKYFDTVFSKFLNDKTLGMKDLDMDNLIGVLTKLELSTKDFEILTGLLFRLYSANMTFAGEVFSGENANGRLSDKTTYKRFDSVIKEFYEGISVSFEEYAMELLYPYLKKNKYKNLTIEKFIMDFNLRNSEKFIKENNDDIIFLTSVDDVLMTKEDLEYIKNTFNNRVLLPFGGHTGLLWHKDIANLMVDKLEEK